MSDWKTNQLRTQRWKVCTDRHLIGKCMFWYFSKGDSVTIRSISSSVYQHKSHIRTFKCFLNVFCTDWSKWRMVERKPTKNWSFEFFQRWTWSIKQSYHLLEVKSNMYEWYCPEWIPPSWDRTPYRSYIMESKFVSSFDCMYFEKSNLKIDKFSHSTLTYTKGKESLWLDLILWNVS